MNSSSIMGYAALSPGAELTPFTYAPPKLSDHEVRVTISHCGICGSDLQAIDNYYAITKYPFVPGHEIVGKVSEIGNAVTQLSVGDRVGIGWQARACMECECCQRGEVNLCEEVATNGTWMPYGGFSTSITAEENFAYKLPEKLPSEIAAVLMCAGISVYKPLKMFCELKQLKAGIIGVGGLGHLAIQFAKSLDYEVTAISSSLGKRDEALSLGADHFILANDDKALQEFNLYFDILFCTSHGRINWEDMFVLLKRKGRLVMIGFPDMNFKSTDIVAHELTISGSFIGKPSDMREMLLHAQTYDIHPMIELMPSAEINSAIRRVRDNKAHYRIVLVNE